jgi:DNA-binding NarL/FixJ family response regulator
MPKKDGITVVWEIRAHYPDAKLIVVTGYDPGALPIAEELGVDRTFTKPFGKNDIVEAVNTLLAEDSQTN